MTEEFEENSDVASIRPRVLDRGDGIVVHNSYNEESGFNSATGFRPWRQDAPKRRRTATIALQFGHGF